MVILIGLPEWLLPFTTIINASLIIFFWNLVTYSILNSANTKKSLLMSVINEKTF